MGGCAVLTGKGSGQESRMGSLHSIPRGRNKPGDAKVASMSVRCVQACEQLHLAWLDFCFALTKPKWVI